MTDNEIVKALECCRKNEKQNTAEYCLKCPFSKCDLGKDEDSCIDALYNRTIRLIRRKKAKIERLQKERKQNDQA